MENLKDSRTTDNTADNNAEPPPPHYTSPFNLPEHCAKMVARILPRDIN